MRLVNAPPAAFPGVNQNLGANQMLFPIGYAKNTALQVSLKQHLEHPFPGGRNFDLQVVLPVGALYRFGNG